jgi:hypothetical protein
MSSIHADRPFLGQCLYKKATLHKLSTTLLTGVNKYDKKRVVTKKKYIGKKRQPLPRIGSAGLSAYVNSGKLTHRTIHLFLFYLSKMRTSYQQFCFGITLLCKIYPQEQPVNFLTPYEGLVYNLK